MADGIRSNMTDGLEVTEQDSGGVSAGEARNNLQDAKIGWPLQMGRRPFQWIFHWTSPRRAVVGLVLLVVGRA
jgi:hypothetical protein